MNSFVLEFEKAFATINENLFDSNLNKVPVTLQPKKKVGIKWHQQLKSIIIGEEFPYLAEHEINCQLLHEMVHIYNFQNDILDVTANQYHKKEFQKIAIQVGLIVVKHKTQGWGITSTIYPRNVIDPLHVKRPKAESIAKRNETFAKINYDQKALEFGRNEIISLSRSEKPTKTYFLKYECKCPLPHNSIRSGRRPDGSNPPNLLCLDCNTKVRCVTDTDN